MTSFVMTGITDPGRVRDINEDAYLVSPESRLAVLADGMGGHLAGEVASAMAVEIVTRELTRFIERLRACPEGSDRPSLAGALATTIDTANRAILEAARDRPECQGMGTTIVVTVMIEGKIYVAHVGDSRLYRLRDGALAQLTEDHSMVQELLRRGFLTPDEARTSSNKNLVTRALGVDMEVQPDITAFDCEAGDLYLLCTDGVTDVLADADIETALRLRAADPDHALRRLVEEANQRGGPDNITAVLVRAGDDNSDDPATTGRRAARKLN